MGQGQEAFHWRQKQSQIRGWRWLCNFMNVVKKRNVHNSLSGKCDDLQITSRFLLAPSQGTGELRKAQYEKHLAPREGGAITVLLCYVGENTPST